MLRLLWSEKLYRSIRNFIKSLLYPIYEYRLVRALDFSQTPHHVGVILDGNRRFAKANSESLGGSTPAHGHRAGANKIVEFLGWCEEAEVRVVTLWLLSTDNFKRTDEELTALLEIIGIPSMSFQQLVAGILKPLAPWIYCRNGWPPS